MAHVEQHNFAKSIKAKFPNNFNNVKALDCGSLDVNGTFKDLFTSSEYIGVDIVAGRNVDIVSHIKDIDIPHETFDTVISGEMLEHDETWKESLRKMYDLTKRGGLIMITCAGKGRKEHGTRRTGKEWGTSPDYYMNLTEDNFKEVYKSEMFSQMFFEYNERAHDQYFYGIKA